MTKAAASRRLREIGATAADLAHNFNNLLTIITAAVDAALARPSIDSETRSDLMGIRTSVEGGAAMVRRLLACGDLPRGNLRLAAIDPIVEAFAPTLRRVIGPRIRLELTLGLPAGAALVDADELRHALLNLTVNARDAMPDGGLLSIATSMAELQQPLAAIPQPVPPGRYAIIELRDSGAGIAPELMQQVFVPFFTTKSAPGGSGLGLSSVRETARRHGGFVTISSTPGVGTEVRLYLPLHDASSRAGAGRHVLLVEDEPVLRRFMTRLLDGKGWRVTAFAEARSALGAMSGERADHNTPDVIISDIGLPDMEGPALVRAARRIRPDLPAILVSGYAEDSSLADLTRVAYLRKPFGAAELLDLLASLTASSPNTSGIAESA
jgi:two-component system cell cycle sensor histidine kinase/response regulator CckA